MEQLQADMALHRNSATALAESTRALRKRATAMDQWDTVARLTESEQHLRWAAGDLEIAIAQLEEVVGA